MNDDRVRLLADDELRGSVDLFRSSVHATPAEDAVWSRETPGDWSGRVYGAFDGGLAGTAGSFASRTTVPGGATVPTAAVSRVGVAPGRTRRGHLRALMRPLLDDAVARGEVLATLRASEAPIYGRFGFGVGTRSEDVRVGTGSAFRPDAPAGGTVRTLTPARAAAELPGVYDRLAPSRRPGGMDRPAGWWARELPRLTDDGAHLGVAVHTGPDGDDGFALYSVERDWPRLTVRVPNLHARDASAAAGLWRFLLGLDLVDDVLARVRPLDEDLGLMLTDPRRFRIEQRGDDLWVRLLDVPAALAARTWGDAAPVTLRLHDPVLPANDGVLRIGPDGPKPVEGSPEPDLECDVDALAMAYLGDRSPSRLAAAGRWRVHDDAALARADALFATGRVPFCGTPF